jgi:hypothetical protein
MTEFDVRSLKLLKECWTLKKVFGIVSLCLGISYIAFAVFIFIKGAAFLGLIVYVNTGALLLSYITILIYTDMAKSKYLSSTVKSRKLYTAFLPFFVQLPCWLYMLVAVLSCMCCRFMHRSLVWFWPELLSLCISNFIVCILLIPVRRTKEISYIYFLLLTLSSIPLNLKRLSVYALPWWTRSTVPALFVCAVLIVLTAVLSLVLAEYTYERR